MEVMDELQCEHMTFVKGNNSNEVQFDDDRYQRDSTIQNEIMPMLIKEGLKFTIQAKRRAKGLDDLKVENYCRKPDELTSEDLERRRIRRERNRIAAAKCRKKTQSRLTILAQEVKCLEEANVRLHVKVKQLEAEKAQLSEVLQSHMAENRTCLVHSPEQYTATADIISEPTTPTDIMINTMDSIVRGDTAFSPISTYTGELSIIDWPSTNIIC
ncbi:uncharacterized protein LOC144453503 isoform X2 [Glandiceps talaboti]